MCSSDLSLRRARNQQLDHWKGVLSGVLDNAWTESARSIATEYARLGLDAHWFVGMYGFMFERLGTMASEIYPQVPDKRERLARALQQAALFDLNQILRVFLAPELLTQLQAEKAATDRVLKTILPAEIAEEMKRAGGVAPKEYLDATVLLAELDGFGSTLRRLDPASLIAVLDLVLGGLDRIVARGGLRKVNAMGDRYLAVAGVPEGRSEDARLAASAALAMTAFCDEVSRAAGLEMHLRVAINKGPIVGGVVGSDRLGFDVWGDALMLAQILQASGAPGQVQVTEVVRAEAAAGHSFEPRSPLLLKDYGRVRAHYVRERRSLERRRAEALGLAKSLVESGRVRLAETSIASRINRWLTEGAVA